LKNTASMGATLGSPRAVVVAAATLLDPL
jgi:hypothetical protein